MDAVKCSLLLYGGCGKIDTTYRVRITSAHTEKHTIILVVVVNMSHLNDLFTYLIFIRKCCTGHHCLVFNCRIIFHAEIIWRIKQNSIKTYDKIIESSSYLCDYLKNVFSKICGIRRSVPCNSVFMWGKHFHCRNSLMTFWSWEDFFCQYDVYKYGAKTWWKASRCERKSLDSSLMALLLSCIRISWKVLKQSCWHYPQSFQFGDADPVGPGSTHRNH